MSESVLSDRLATLTTRLHRKAKWRAKQKPKAKTLSTSVDPTFPERLKPLAEKFCQQALNHPAYVLWSPSEIRQSIENRLWSLVADYPQWFGSGSSTKREATPAQLAALLKAREAKSALTEEERVREQRISKRAEEITAA